MLDTNICIYVLKTHSGKILDKFNATKELTISSIVYAELLYGIELSHRKLQKERSEQLRRFFQYLIIAPWDEPAAKHYSDIRGILKKNGKMIGNMDLLIGAHARSLDSDLVTNNTKEFKRIPHLRLQNWVS